MSTIFRFSRFLTDSVPSSATELASGNLCVYFPELGPLLPRLLRSVPHRRSAHETRPTDQAPQNTNTPMPPKRAWRGWRERRERDVMDSGIGLSAYNGGGKSYRERFLPRGWMDSGIGSHAITLDSLGTISGHTSDEISPASTKDAHLHHGVDKC
jgi:hypothetical protein